jgi:ammonia channel protein AmtB
VGVLVICTIIFGLAYGFFSIQNRVTRGGIRPEAEHEIAGLDLIEMGVPAYSEADR